jgi:hypothetical protein
MSRKVILGFGISLDGYIARRNGSMDFLVLDKEGEALMMDFFAKIDTTIKFPQRNFRLTECKSYSNGSVGLRYERMRTKTNR